MIPRLRFTVQGQINATAVVAIVVFGALSAIHLQQRHVRAEASRNLADFRAARLDVAVGFAHVLGASGQDAPFDQAQGRVLLRQGVRELRRSRLTSTAHPTFAHALDATEAALSLVQGAKGGAELVTLRLAVSRLDAVAGRVDADAELQWLTTAERQDNVFAATVIASGALLGALFVLLRRSARRAETEAVARAAADRARRASHAREHEAAELLKAVVAGIPDAVFVKDAEGRYVLLNEAALQTAGSSLEKFLGKRDDELWDEASAKAIVEHDQLVLSSKTTSTREERITLGGKSRVFLAAKAPRFDAKGNVIGLVGISRDITERLELEEQVRQSQKMEAIGRLASGVAHDFNNVLLVIQSWTELLLEAPPDDPEALRATLGEIREASERAAALTAQLLALSRKAVVSPRAVDLCEAVQRSARLYRRLIGEDVVVSTSIWPAPCIVRVDPSSLDQVIMNLSVNARDAMPRGGTLELATSIVEVTSGSKTGTWAELRVTDSGSGIPTDALDHIFEPFFTTKGVGRGTGLGLSVVDGIVAQAGGHIEVESALGKGATFRVWLPLAASTLADPPLSAIRATRPRGRETILVVEDDDSVRSLVKRSLERLGYRVLEAQNGDTALDVAQNEGQAIDLLLTDVVMPKMSGGELAQRLRSLRPQLRVLFMSGYNDDAIVHQEITTGHDVLLAKPFTPSELSNKVRQVLDASPELPQHLETGGPLRA